MKINGKDYNLGEITFKTMCDLESMGINVSNMMDKPMNTILAFATIAIGDKQVAEREMNEQNPFLSVKDTSFREKIVIFVSSVFSSAF